MQERLADRDWRLNNLYMVIDEHGKRVRFKPNWAQQRLFDTLGHKNLSLKVRQIGVTTGYCILWLDTVLFNPNIKIGVVAHTEPDAKKILRDKIQYAYDQLPETLRLALPPKVRNSEELSFENGSSISVDVSFRGGTVQILHVTEYGHICQIYPNRAHEIKTGAMQAVHESGILVVESTAKEPTGHFHELCLEAQKPNSEYRFQFLAWWEEPEYIKSVDHPIEYPDEKIYLDSLGASLKRALTPEQRQWWCAKHRLLGDDVYTEFPSTPEEAFKVSTRGAYYAKQMLDAFTQGRVTKVPVDRALLVETWWDIGVNDTTAIWFIQRDGYWIRVVDCYEASDEGVQHYASKIQEWSRLHSVMYSKHIGPHDLKVREWGNGDAMTRWDAALKLGLRFEVAPLSPIADGIETVRSLLSRCVFDEEKTRKGVEALQHYRKEWNPSLRTYKNQPLHDWSSHFADAFRTGASVDKIMQPQGSSRIVAKPIQRQAWR